MKFDIEREMKSTPFYDKMNEDMLAFTKATDYGIIRAGNVGCHYYKHRRGNPFWLSVDIGRDGKMSAKLESNRTGKIAKKTIGEFQEVLSDLLLFLETCFDHKFLRRDEEVTGLPPILCYTCQFASNFDFLKTVCVCKRWANCHVGVCSECPYYCEKVNADEEADK